MSEEAVVETPETPEAPVLTPEQKMAYVKINISNSLVQRHNELYNFVSTLPINDDQKKFALANLIQALHWVEDGIEALVFEVIQPPPPGDDTNVKEGFQQENNSEEHQNGSEGGQEAVTGCGDSLQQSGQEQEQEKVS